VKAAITK
jgi:hypothetical protein